MLGWGRSSIREWDVGNECKGNNCHFFKWYLSHFCFLYLTSFTNNFCIYSIFKKHFQPNEKSTRKKKKVMWRGLNRRKKTEWNKKGRLNHILLRWIKSDKCWENLLKQSHHFLSFSNFSICFPSFIWFFKGQFMVKTHFNTVQMTLCPGLPSCKKVLQNCLLLPC